jgi:hypothetical protein
MNKTERSRKTRGILSFITIYPDSSEYTHPRGYSVCKFLRDELARLGFNVLKLDNYRDIAWSLDCEVDGKKIFFFVGYLGTKVTDWQLIVCSGVGIIGRLLGKSDEGERIKLSKAIHTILSDDNRFTELKWFSQYTDNPKDMWYSEPI